MGMTIAQGLIQQGAAIGETKGRLKGSRETVVRLGRKKFGEPDAQAMQMLQASEDADHLDRRVDAILEVASWAVLLRVR